MPSFLLEISSVVKSGEILSLAGNLFDIFHLQVPYIGHAFHLLVLD